MKKIAALIMLLFAVLFIAGCGQDVEVTIYNASGVYGYANQYILIEARGDHLDQWKYAADVAHDDSELNEDNSFTVKMKENSTLEVEAEGQYYTVDGNGNTSLTKFNTNENGTFSATIYGGFPSAPKWYAACYKDGVTIYKK